MGIELTPEVLNAALRLSLEMGEAMRKPIDARLREKFPKLTPAETEEADITCRTIKRMVFKWIERVHLGKRPEADARQNIVQEWPWIDAENLSHLWSQGMYFACRG